MERFKLDAEQTDAILELKIYRLARLEILVIQKELAEKRKRAKEIGALLKSDADLWKIIRAEIELIQKTYGDARRTEITGEIDDEEYTADDFIIEEDNVVIVTRDGWVKRQKEIKDIASTRTARRRRGAGGDAGQHARDGRVLHELRRGLHGEDRRHAGVHRLRRADSEPVQVQGRREGRRRAESRSARRSATITSKNAGDAAAGARDRRLERRLQPALLARAIRRAEHARRPPVRARRRGRRNRRRREDRPATEIMIAATRQARAMLCKVDEINFLSGPGRGVILIKLQKEDDRLLGFIASTGDRDLMTVETTRGAEQTISTTKYGVTGRGGKGRELLQRGEFMRVVPQAPELPPTDGVVRQITGIRINRDLERRPHVGTLDCSSRRYEKRRSIADGHRRRVRPRRAERGAQNRRERRCELAPNRRTIATGCTD